MKLTVLGCGTGSMVIDRHGPAYQLLDGAGLRIMVDCGSGALRQWLRSGFSLGLLDAVFITHTHADHVADLAALLHGLKLPPEPMRSAPLTLFGPPGFKSFCDEVLFKMVSPSTHFECVVKELLPGWVEWRGLRVGVQSVVHHPRLHSNAYRFEQDGKSVVLSGDCDWDKGLIEFSQGADLLVLDCSLPDEEKVVGHLSPSECGKLATQAGAGRVLLSHLYPTAQADHIRVVQCQRYYAGRVALAEELKQYVVGQGDEK